MLNQRGSLFWKVKDLEPDFFFWYTQKEHQDKLPNLLFWVTSGDTNLYNYPFQVRFSHCPSEISMFTSVSMRHNWVEKNIWKNTVLNVLVRLYTSESIVINAGLLVRWFHSIHFYTVNANNMWKRTGQIFWVWMSTWLPPFTHPDLLQQKRSCTRANKVDGARFYGERGWLGPEEAMVGEDSALILSMERNPKSAWCPCM